MSIASLSIFKAIIGLFAGIGIVLGFIAGQGLAKKERRQAFKDTFFSRYQTDESKALKEFEQKVLGDTEEEGSGLISKQNFSKN